MSLSYICTNASCPAPAEFKGKEFPAAMDCIFCSTPPYRKDFIYFRTRGSSQLITLLSGVSIKTYTFGVPRLDQD